MDLVHVDQPLTGSAWAIGVLGYGLVVGGLPIASIGLILSALTKRHGYRWRAAWHAAFQAGFVAQICSLVPTVPVWLMLLLSSGLPGRTAWETVATLILSASVVGGCIALRAWRELMAAVVPESPSSIVGGSRRSP